MIHIKRLRRLPKTPLRCKATRASGILKSYRFWLLMAAMVFILSKPLGLMSISAYQRFISPYKGWRCAYAVLHHEPSCSEYGKAAISRHGVISGLWLLWNRFDDCGKAADILIASSESDRIGKECADGCVRGCCSGPSQRVSQPISTRPRPTPRPRPSVASITDVAPKAWGIYDATGTYSDNYSVVTITWKSTGLSGNVNIDVARNKLTNTNPRKWERVLSNVANTGRVEWVPTGLATPFARIRVQSAERSTVSGINSADFCIYGPYYKGCPGGFCTEYAAREFDKVSPGSDWVLGNAGLWFDKAAAQNWKTTTDTRQGEAGAIVVWTYGKYGHVAVLRGYQQNGESEILPTYPQDTNGTVYAIIDEQNAGKMIDKDSAITNLFGQVTRKQLPASDFDRNALKFKGMILPEKAR